VSALKLRIKFTKQGSVKFVGHLDIMRYFQKAMRRADIDIKYSEGFNPHQIMSFAAPLGVGITSNGEYMDVELNSMSDCKTVINQLSEAMVPGIQITECHKLEDRAKKSMALVAGADYTLTFREGKEPTDIDDFLNGLTQFLEQEHIIITKKTKKGEKEMDIKPLIYELSINGTSIFMKVSTGSTNNLKPELVMKAYDTWRGETCPEFTFQIQREEIYGNAGDEKNPNLVPLGQIGELIE
jgi:radical SAM-linked protein